MTMLMNINFLVLSMSISYNSSNNVTSDDVNSHGVIDPPTDVTTKHDMVVYMLYAVCVIMCVLLKLNLYFNHKKQRTRNQRN